MYVIIFSVLTMKWNQYKAHKNAVKHLDLAPFEQSEALQKAFCESCKIYGNA